MPEWLGMEPDTGAICYTLAMAAGFARVMAKVRTQQEQHKPMLGKPFLHYGQCLVLSGYFMQLGSLLGAKHRDKPDEFIHAFLGLTGEPGAAMRFFVSADQQQMPLLSKATTFTDYVLAEQCQRVHPGSTPDSLFMEQGMAKLSVETGAELAWQFAEAGAIFGVMHPEGAREMFEASNRKRESVEWERARVAGLDIPPEQDVITFDECLAGEDEAFLSYCQECAPDLYATLA